MSAPRKPLSRPSKRVVRPSAGARILAGATHASAALARPLARRPVLSASLAAFAAFFGVLATNALTAQNGRHAHPLMATRPAAGEADSADASPAAGLSVPLVAEVQTALAEAGYYAAPVDGRPGKATTAAIRKFQSDHGLSVDGEASPKVLAALRRTSAEKSNWEQRVASLDPEDTGTVTDATSSPRPDKASATPPPRDLVRRIQEGLTSAKVADLHADGIMGGRTEAAIRSFQASQGMAVTGVPDDAVLARLKALGTPHR